jgi:undecaprenyl-diphosphatase
MWEQLVEWDRELFRFLNGLWLDDFDALWLFITQVRNWIPLYFIFIFLIYKAIPRWRNLVAISGIFITAFSTLYLTNVVKNLIERLRPNNEPILMDSIKILQNPENFSFWSGHSAVSFAVVTYVVLILKSKHNNWIYTFYLWPILFAFSRIFVGVHYPVDIIVGMVVGLTLGACFYKLFKVVKLPDSR